MTDDHVEQSGADEPWAPEEGERFERAQAACNELRHLAGIAVAAESGDLEAKALETRVPGVGQYIAHLMLAHPSEVPDLLIMLACDVASLNQAAHKMIHDIAARTGRTDAAVREYYGLDEDAPGLVV